MKPFPVTSDIKSFAIRSGALLSNFDIFMAVMTVIASEASLTIADFIALYF